MATFLFPLEGKQIVIEDDGNLFCVRVESDFKPITKVSDDKVEVLFDTKSWPRFEKQSFIKQLESFIDSQKKYGKINKS